MMELIKTTIRLHCVFPAQPPFGGCFFMQVTGHELCALVYNWPKLLLRVNNSRNPRYKLASYIAADLITGYALDQMDWPCRRSFTDSFLFYAVGGFAGKKH